MLRRCTASLALLSGTWILAGGLESASASSVVSEMMVNGVDTIVPAGTPGSTMYAYYQVTNPRSSTVASGLNDLVVSTVVPPNSITPINATTSPLSIVNGSFGFDTKNLQVFLSPPDAATQQIAVLFGNGGLAAGGTLDFKVSLDPSYGSPTVPTLTLQAPFANLSSTAPVLMSYTPASANAAPNASPANTPEPASLALWSALAGGGLLAARGRRRAGRRARPAAPVAA